MRIFKSFRSKPADEYESDDLPGQRLSSIDVYTQSMESQIFELDAEITSLRQIIKEMMRDMKEAQTCKLALETAMTVFRVEEDTQRIDAEIAAINFEALDVEMAKLG